METPPPPVPVWVGVDGPRDGYEHPRDESCLQGQLKGDFLGEKRGFGVSRKPGPKPNAQVRAGSRCDDTPGQPCDSDNPSHPSRGRGKSGSQDTETLIL